MTTFIVLGVLVIVNLIICSFVSILFRQTRKVDWGICLVISFMISLTAIWALGT
jgi:hypothetical protein